MVDHSARGDLVGCSRNTHLRLDRLGLYPKDIEAALLVRALRREASREGS